jgi:hypothetical protein
MALNLVNKIAKSIAREMGQTDKEDYKEFCGEARTYTASFAAWLRTKEAMTIASKDVLDPAQAAMIQSALNRLANGITRELIPTAKDTKKNESV